MGIEAPAIEQAGQYVGRRLLSQPHLGVHKLGNFKARGDETVDFPIVVTVGNDGGCDPVMTAILGTVTQVAMPCTTGKKRSVHAAEECPVMLAGIQHAVGPAQKFLAGILADFAKFVVYVRNRPVSVRYGYNQDIIDNISPEVGIVMRKGAEPVIMLCGHAGTSNTG
ncbi:hypothetical protein AA0614_0561 [Komagataeibacter saccharivorans NRIC 0614]|nr:hypothetical protein AA0614_0561 [Komagataeibacter saccharivorans NRIC 0614]